MNSRGIKVFAWLTLAGFVVAAGSQARLQVFRRDAVLDLGEKSGRFLVKRVEPARRGAILSADNRPLAQDASAREFGPIFDDVPFSRTFFMELSEASGIPASEMLQLKASGVRTTFWREPLTESKAKRVEDVKIRWRADGVSLRRVAERDYPLGIAAAGVVGALRDGKPITGIEVSKSKTLEGHDGLTIGLTDSKGKFLPMRIDPRTKTRVDGEDVVLTLDSRLQLVATQALKEAVESNNADQGAVVILNPKTGDILAMANWPSYDPARLGRPTGSKERFTDFNPNYMAALEPGSTFKILTLALALEKGVVNSTDVVQCGGSLQVWSNRSVRCDLHGGTRAHGTVDLEKAISKSCNVSAATWALRVGSPDFIEFLNRSGLMRKTQLGLPLEASGQFVRDEYAKGLQLATFGFGQSMTCTPVGLASVFSALGNGGVRMEPRLIAKVGGRDTKEREAGRLFSKETADQVLGYMESVIESDSGTGKSLRIPGYRLAGKTGTAQKINRSTGTVEGGGYVSNFVGLVPAQNPQALILVMIDNPKAGKYYGASVAGPVFVESAQAVVRLLGIPPTPGKDVVPSPKASPSPDIEIRSTKQQGGASN